MQHVRSVSSCCTRRGKPACLLLHVRTAVQGTVVAQTRMPSHAAALWTAYLPEAGDAVRAQAATLRAVQQDGTGLGHL